IIHALIIGEDVLARIGLRTLLQVSGRVAIVGEADGGHEALAQIGRLGADVALLHARANGSGVLTELRELGGHTPVLLPANDRAPPAIERALHIGATGYLINGQYGPDELIAAVEATAQGQPRLSPRQYGCWSTGFVRSAATVSRPTRDSCPGAKPR